MDGSEPAGRQLPGVASRSGLNASPLVHGVSGRIVYRDPPPSRQAFPAAPACLRLRLPSCGRKWCVGRAGSAGANTGQRRGSRRPAAGGRCTCAAATRFRAKCTAIDEKGVTFKTPLSDATFVSHDKIKERGADPDDGTLPQLDETKRDRLLTLPRMQKDSPPTHLICSKNGDFLRGRILAMDDDAAEGRSPAGDQGDSPRPSRADHLAARRRADGAKAAAAAVPVQRAIACRRIRTRTAIA